MVAQSDRKYRKAYEQTFLPVGRFLARLGVTANQVSFVSLFVAVLSMTAYWAHLTILGMALMLLSGILDMMDGSVARATNTAGPFGTVLDPTFDRYAEFFILIGMLLGEYAEGGVVVFCLFGMIMASYIRAKAESSGELTGCSVGIAERKEKIGILIAGSLLEAAFEYWPDFFTFWTEYVSFGPLAVAIAIVGIISHISAMQRLKFAYDNAPN